MAKQLHEQALGNANVQNFLRMLATAEGTLKNGADPYRVGFGGSQIADLSAHPNIVKSFRQTDGKMNKTSAAGAYQFLNKTWTPLQQQLGLKDFSPRSQDIAAIELIRQAGALDDITRGNYGNAIKKTGRIWASLPSSPHAQPKRSSSFIEKALGISSAHAGTLPPQPMKPQKDKWDALVEEFSTPQQAPQQAGQGAPAQQPMQQQAAPQADKWDALVKEFSAPPQPAPNQAPVAPASVPKPVQQAGAFDGLTSAISSGANKLKDFGVSTYMALNHGMIDAIAPAAVGIAKVSDWATGGTKSQDQVREQVKTAHAEFDKRHGTGVVPSLARMGGQMMITIPVTAGAGELLGVAGQAVNMPVVKALGGAVARGGMGSNGLKGGLGLGVDALGGAINGAITTGMVNPDSVKQGVITGALMPTVGAGLKTAGRGLLGTGLSASERALADKAKDLNIRIPADRYAKSKPLNALAGSLEYIPFSGRGASIENMNRDITRAAARTMGQDTDDIILAYQQAKPDLGGKFDAYLKEHGMRVNSQSVERLQNIAKQADDELVSAKPIRDAVDNILNSGGMLDGNKAYNLKKSMSSLAERNPTFTPYAKEIEGTILDGIADVAGSARAADFAKTKQQYSAMKTLEPYIPTGADEVININKLANIKHTKIHNQELKDVVDIAAKWGKQRESNHGNMQRVMQYLQASLGLGGSVAGGVTGGALGGVTGGAAALAPVVVTGYGANKALNSQAARNLVMHGMPTSLLSPNVERLMVPTTTLMLNEMQR